MEPAPSESAEILESCRIPGDQFPAKKLALRSITALGWAIGGGVLLYLIFHLFQLINKYAVNLLFQDNFNYYFTLARRWNFWERFDIQLGPHRQGLGLLLSSAIAPLSRWNMRAEAFAIGVILTGALFLCLWMKKRAFNRLYWYDFIVLPCFFLTPRQYQIWCMTVNSSHGALPLFLVVVYCLSWTINHSRLRNSCVLVVNFLAVFTGFGLFLGIVNLIIFALTRNKFAVMVALATWLLFFFNYRFDPANPNFLFFDPEIVKLPYAVAIGLSHAANIVDRPWDQICGYCMLGLMAFILARHWRGIIKSDAQSIIIVSLIGFTLLFVLATVEGRISFGENCLDSSRYVPLILPGFVGAYLAIARLRSQLAKVFFVLISLNVAVNMSLNTRWDDLHMMDEFKIDKEVWLRTYRSTGDLDKADHAGFMPIYPDPRFKDIKVKIEYLRTHKLNFFATD